MALEIGPIRHVALFTPDLNNHARFYSETWGLEQIALSTDSIYFRGLSAEPFILSLHRHKRRGLHHIGYSMSGKDAVDRAAADLKKSGVRVVDEPHMSDEPGGGYGFRFIDPDGRCIELSSGGSGIVEARSRPVQPHSICHVVNNTPNLAATTDFYTHVLGFRISDWSGQQMVFLRSDTKHHNISFNAAPHASVNHIAYLVSGVDELMRGLVNLRKNGFEVAWGPGRHGPGNNIFCYFKDPFGYVVEYTCDIDYIANEAKHEPKVWPRGPDSMDRWGIVAPPSPELREAMTGEPDRGWA